MRSRSFTGKPCRMLRNEWTEAWERPDTPEPLGMPLQFMVTGECVVRGTRYADKAQAVAFNPVGQVVGQLNAERKTRDVMQDLVEGYLERRRAPHRPQRLTVRPPDVIQPGVRQRT